MNQTDSLKGKKLSIPNFAMYSATSPFVPMVMKSVDKKQVIPSPF